MKNVRKFKLFWYLPLFRVVSFQMPQKIKKPTAVTYLSSRSVCKLIHFKTRSIHIILQNDKNCETNKLKHYKDTHQRTSSKKSLFTSENNRRENNSYAKRLIVAAIVPWLDLAQPPQDAICHSLIYSRLTNTQGENPSKITKLIRQHLLQVY